MEMIRKKTLVACCLFFASQSPAQEAPYMKPLWFDVVNKGVKVSSPVVQYDLQSSKGQSLTWGPLKLEQDFFSINLTSRQKLDAEGSQMAFYNQEDMVLFFDWPQEILPYGTLDVLDSEGKSLWNKPLAEADLKAWHEKIIQVKDQLRKQGKSEEEVENNSLLKKTYAFFRSKSEPGPTLEVDTKYQFCLKNVDGASFVRICTPFYLMKTVGTQIELQIPKPKKKSAGEALIKHQDQPQPLSGRIIADPAAPTHFFAQLKSGATVEFKVHAPSLKIYDMVLTDESQPELSQLVAENPAPVFMKSEPLRSRDPLDSMNKLWKGDYKISDKKIFLPGTAGAFFQYDIEVEYLPKAQQRPYANEKYFNISYSEKDPLKVRSTSKPELESWLTTQPKKGTWNRSYLVVKDEKHEHQAYLDIYRGYAGEASLRLTALTAGSGNVVLMPEVHVGYWFNSVAGWDQHYLSRQRWGVSAKYVDLLSSIPAETDTGVTEDVKIQSMLVDLKYRFTPGLWERDETWGAVLSYENLSYAEHKVPKIGYGFFWARSMPKIFDDLFNRISFLRYPKWVDLDVIKYSTSLDSNYALGDDFAVNFHGKILWTPRFYGEAGFGLKRYYFLRATDLQGASLDTFYGTLGLGVNF